MILDLLDCLTAPAGVLTPYSPTAIGANNNSSFIDRMIPMDDGAGELLTFLVQVTAAVTSAGSATVQFQLLGNPTDSTFSSNNIVLGDTGAIPKATLVTGYRFATKIPRAPFKSYEINGTTYVGPCRYLQLNVIIGTATLTAGSFEAWVGNNTIQDSITYNRNYTV